MTVLVIRAAETRKATQAEDLLSWFEAALASAADPSQRALQRPRTVIVLYDEHGPAITIPCHEPDELARQLDPLLAAQGLHRTFPAPLAAA